MQSDPNLEVWPFAKAQRRCLIQTVIWSGELLKLSLSFSQRNEILQSSMFCVLNDSVPSKN